MKKTYFLFLFVLLSFTVTSRSIVLDGKQYQIDTISNFSAGPGTQHLALRLNSDKRLDVFFLKVDASNPYVSFKSALGRDSIYGGERPSAVAARKSKPGEVYFAGTNADFYNVSDYPGYPLGGCIVENEIAKVPATERPVIAFEKNKTPYIGRISYNGTIKSGTTAHTLNGANHLREANQLILYNQYNGKTTRTSQDGTEVLLELNEENQWAVSKTIKAKVIKTERNKGNMPIPKGNAVLSGNGNAVAFLNALSVDDEVEVTMNIVLEGKSLDISQMVGGDNRNPMLYNGAVETNQVWNELHPRTAVGYSQDKQTIIFCVVDGRGVSAGINTLGLAQLMKSAGAYSAFNMDGGGSSCMYIRQFGAVNDVSDGSERSVGNSLFVVSSAPDDNSIASFQTYTPNVEIAPNAVFQPKFLGYNQFGTLINKDLKGVELTCSPDVGEIVADGSFKATGTRDGIILARYNGKEVTIRVDIVFENDKELAESVSEDFSSEAWDNEFKRLNPEYSTLAAGEQFIGMNNIDLYFDKYSFEGAIVADANTPNCESGTTPHGESDAATAFRFRNSGTSYMEFPEMKSAGSMTIHVRNANANSKTTLTLQKLNNGSWENIHTFNLRARNSYSATSLDEVLSYSIGSDSPIKLRLSRGDRFVNLYRVDITPYGTTNVSSLKKEDAFRMEGRKLIAYEPTEIRLYNVLGKLLLHEKVESELDLPVFIGKGLFFIQHKDGSEKILLK